MNSTIHNHSPLISIITPIYNSEKNLVKCIESILKQSYINIEIILVNDGSTDSSVNICKNFKKEDRRIVLINKKNGGAAQARNRGIKVARGDYVSFVDSDDYIEPDFIKMLFNNIKKYKADVSTCSYFKTYEDRELINPNKPSFLKFNNINAIKDIISDNSTLEVILCNKLFKKDLFTKNNIMLPEGEIYEDTRTMYKLLYHSNTIVFSGRPLYHYLQRPNSVMNHKANIRNLSIQLAIPKEMKEWFKKHNVGLEIELESYNISKQIDAISYIIKDREICKNTWPGLKKDIKNNFKSIIANPYLSKKRKYACVIIIVGKIPYKIMRKIYKMTFLIKTKIKRKDYKNATA